jgi:hypothetical protein
MDFKKARMAIVAGAAGVATAILVAHVCGNDVLGAGAVMISDFVVTHLGRYAAEATAFTRSTWRREFDAAQIAARATACRPTISNLLVRLPKKSGGPSGSGSGGFYPCAFLTRH